MAIVLLFVGLLLGAGISWAFFRLGGQADRDALEERLRAAGEARTQLSDAFNAMCAEALHRNNTAFLQLAKQQLEGVQGTASADLTQRQQAIEALVSPIKETLSKFEKRVQEIENARTGAYGELKALVHNLALGQRQLQQETGNLVTALRSPVVRGRWGEIQLRRVVEMAGMLAYCDFQEQVTHTADGRTLRPDLVVKLPGGKNVVVDAKAPLQAYLEALEAKDDETRKARLHDHARQIRDHIAKLSAKSYWSQLEPTPEFVVLFIPGETFFSAALEADPSLIEEGVNQQVILATPTTLIALLRAVAYGWRQETVAENARTISALGQELYSRLATLTNNFGKVRRGLESAVQAYNDAVGSLERSVLPSARRFKEHGAATGDLPVLEPVEHSVRALQAPELLALEEPQPERLPAAADAA